MNDEEIPEDINVDKQIWGKDADQVKWRSMAELFSKLEPVPID